MSWYYCTEDTYEENDYGESYKILTQGNTYYSYCDKYKYKYL